jgi:hypothetical protein
VVTLNMLRAILQATRLVESDWVTATSMSASSMPAFFSTEGRAPLPTRVRTSRRSAMSPSASRLWSTMVMSLASEASASATEAPTWPAPRMMMRII